MCGSFLSINKKLTLLINSLSNVGYIKFYNQFIQFI